MTPASQPAVKIAAVDPPPVSRPRETTVPAEVIASMVEVLDTGAEFVGDNVKYAKHTEASNAAARYKSALTRHLKVPSKALRSRVWGVTEQPAEVKSNDPKRAPFMFGIGKRPSAETPAS